MTLIVGAKIPVAQPATVDNPSLVHDVTGAAGSPPPSASPAWYKRWFAGRDAFISYARSDGSAYAAGMAEALGQHGLTCWFDQWGTSPGKKLPLKLVRALRRSSVLVLVGSPGAVASDHVGEEIESFLGTGKYIIPVSLDDTYDRGPWFASIAGLPVSKESEVATARGKPTPSIVDRIANTVGYWKQSRRIAGMLGVLSLLAVALAGAAGYAGWRAEQNRIAAETNAISAQQSAGRALEQERRAKTAVNREADALQKAKSATRRETIALQEARDAAREARTQQREAERQAAQALGQQRLARLNAAVARAEELHHQSDIQLGTSVGLALEAQLREPNPQADAILRTGLRLMAPRTGLAPVRLGRYPAVAIGGSWLVALEADSQMRVWRQMALVGDKATRVLDDTVFRKTVLPANSPAFAADVCARGALVADGAGVAFHSAEGGPAERLLLDKVIQSVALTRANCVGVAVGEGGMAWVIDTGKLQARSRPIELQGWVQPWSITVSGDATRLAAIGPITISKDVDSARGLERQPDFRQVRVWDLETGRQVASFPDTATAVALDANGLMLVTASMAGPSVTLHNLAARTSHPIAQRSFVRTLAVSSGGRFLAIGSNDGAAHVYDLSSRAEIARVVLRRQQPVLTVALDEASALLVTLSSNTHGSVDAPTDAEFAAWDVSDHLRSDVPALAVGVLALAPGGRFVAHVEADGVLRVTESASGKVIWTVPSEFGNLRNVTLSADGRYMAFNSPQRGLFVAGHGGGNVIRLSEQGAVTLAMSADGSVIAARVGQRLIAWRRAGNQFSRVGEQPLPRGLPGELAVSAGGQFIVNLNSARPDGPCKVQEARLWALDAGAQPGLREITAAGHCAGMHKPAVSTDGRILVTGDASRTGAWFISTDRRALGESKLAGDVLDIALGQSKLVILRRSGLPSQTWVDVRTVSQGGMLKTPSHSFEVPRATAVTVSDSDDEVIVLREDGRVTRWPLSVDTLRSELCRRGAEAPSREDWARFFSPTPYKPACGQSTAGRAG